MYFGVVFFNIVLFLGDFAFEEWFFDLFLGDLGFFGRILLVF